MLMRFGSLDITKFPDTSISNWIAKPEFSNKDIAILDMDIIISIGTLKMLLHTQENTLSSEAQMDKPLLLSLTRSIT